MYIHIPDMEMSGVLRGVSDSETSIMAETRRKWFMSSLILLGMLLLSIGILVWKSSTGLVVCIILWAYLLSSLYLIVTTTPAKFTKSIRRHLARYIPGRK